MDFYLLIASIFLFNRLGLVGIAMIFPKKYPKYENPYTVILPVKNENPEVLNNCIKKLIEQKGTKQIIIGDDGSSPPISKIIKPEYFKHIEIIRSDKSIGKKEVQLILFKKAKYDIAVQMDSDVILSTNKDLVNLTSYFNKNNKIGIVNGKVRIISKRKLIEKIQEFQYYCANDIGRSGMGRFGVNPCATGELMAFRLDVFKNHLNEYQNKKHINQLMKFGEDRFMTNIFLRQGYKSIVAEDVACFTFPKSTLKSLLKQQKRWKLSGVRESVRCAKEVRNPYLKIWSILNFSLPILFFLLFINILFWDIFYANYMGVLTLFGSLIFISLVAEVPIFIKKPRLILYAIPFAIYNIIFITPMWILSLMKQDETGWGTR